MPSSAGTLRVAVVGLGPKGLFALERLLDRAHAAAIEIVAHEPHPVPGAGPVYDPGQPAYLRMNNAAEHVDLWWPGNATVPPEERRSFLDWDGGRSGGRGAFPPRAVVGGYLADGLAVVLRHAGPRTSVRIEAERVTEVHRAADAGRASGQDGAAWTVRTADGSVADYDEVLLATGHVWRSDRSAADDPAPAGPTGSAARVPGVFPVARRLRTTAVPAGSAVALRGFALTAIDAALALTEGRGGRFLPGATAHRLRYEPGAADVRAIVPFSRTGLPILAKPASDLHDHVGALTTNGEAGRARVRAIAGTGVDVVEALAGELAASAGAALVAVGSPTDPRAPETWLADARPAGDPETARDALARSLDVAVGVRPPGAEWALGHVWRTLYPAVVARLGGSSLDDAGWAAFRALAARLERVAFGPSAANVAKLLALVDAGVLDLDHLTGTLREASDGGTVVRSSAGSRPVDVVVEAVLDGPGVPAGDGGPVAGLVARGDLRLLPGRRGLDVDADGTCRDASGAPVPGLAAVGRPTEDAVIGHDTLSRTLHHEADRWAARVARRAAAAHPTDNPRVRVEEPA